MATIAERVKRRAADRQADVTATHKSKRARLIEPDREENETQYLQHQCIHPNNANKASKHHGTDSSTSIHSLPPELMAMIFSQLDCGDKVRAASVCSYWRDLIDIPYVWKDFSPIIDVDELKAEHIKKMHIRMIRKVNIYQCDDMKKMKRFLLSLPHLKNLSILFQLSLARFCSGKKNIPGIKHLTVFSLKPNTGVLRSFLQPMVNLQHLRLVCFPDQDIFGVLQHSKHLVSLYIKCCIIVVKIEPSMDSLNPVLSLKRLILENMAVGDSGLDFISRAFPQLYNLRLMLPSDITCDGLEKLAKLKQLKDLSIGSGHFELAWFEHLDTELPQLESLYLYGCRISNRCLQSISKLPVLHILSVPIQGQEVEGLQALSQGCPGLQSLSLANGNQSINQGLHVIKCMPNLQDLTLFACSVDDAFWQANSKSFSKLRSLSFIECELVSEQCVPYLSQLPCLKRLWFEKCMAFGNDSMKQLGEWGIFKALTRLQLVELGIQDDSLVELSKNTPFLKYLMIRSCNNVTEDGIADAVTTLPHLKAMETDISAGIKDRLKRIQPHLQFYCI